MVSSAAMSDIEALLISIEGKMRISFNSRATSTSGFSHPSYSKTTSPLFSTLPEPTPSGRSTLARKSNRAQVALSAEPVATSPSSSQSCTIGTRLLVQLMTNGWRTLSEPSFLTCVTLTTSR